ncbi:MAG: selenocysteine-specific translation elongation factor [Candidatus Bathyarchaeota archaeon]|nr:MAG: selenocysteine-specific translation elongation factor [Candidatus Bathyarchaeota archaeon]
MQTPFLLIFCGIPSSGKSTLARKTAEILEEKYQRSTAIISSDAFRRMLPTYERTFEPGLEDFVRGATYRAIQEALRWKLTVISDDMNYFRSIRRQLKRIAERTNAHFGIVYFTTPLEMALKWNRQRGSLIPDSLIEEVYHKLDRPGEKYRWDSPMLTLDPSKEQLATLAATIASKVDENERESSQALIKPRQQPQASISKAELERETRRVVGEVIRRYGNLDLAQDLTRLRRETVADALRNEISVREAASLLRKKAESLLKKAPDISLSTGGTIHVGIFGHVDHGKTQLARCLTEIASTAALDKHPQAQVRGMSIDIGFSAFSLGKNLIVLVDLPGHHSLLKHALAGANIVDSAILTIAADEGMKEQTIEHLQVLSVLGIKGLLVALNKIDLVNEAQLREVRSNIQQLLSKTPFRYAPIVEVSALKCEGIDELRKRLQETTTPPIRDWAGSLKIPISHSFHVTGRGSVATGTVLRGKAHVGDVVEVVPQRREARIKSIEIFGKDVKEASAGDRVGLRLSNIRSRDLSRGDFVIAPGTMEEADLLDTRFAPTQLYSEDIRFGEALHVSGGLRTTVGQIFPYSERGPLRIKLGKIDSNIDCSALIKTREPLALEVGDRLLLAKLDQPHQCNRIVGIAEVTSLQASPEIHSAKIKKGQVKKKTAKDLYAVSGLFRTKQAAEHVAEKQRKVYAVSTKTTGIIQKEYGEDGDVLVKFKDAPKEHEEVHYYRLRRIKID